MNRQNILKTAIMLAATLLIAACTNDEMADSQPESLPEGQYPLEIASVTMSANAPQSRVVENLNDGMSSAWEWDGSEKIGVQLYADGDVATYTLNNYQTLTPDKTLYWKNTEGATITAWYPTYEGESGTVSLANQSGKLAYVLAGAGNGDYKSSVGLTFTHALAKVRVKLSGDKAQEVSKVYLYTYTSCTNTQGIISNGTSAGWIEMKGVTYNNTKCYEANVVPGYDIKKIKINDGNESMLTTTVTPVAAKLHEIAVDVSGPAKVVEISGITGLSYTVKGNISLKGDGNSHDLKLTLEGGAKLTLDGVTLQPQEEGNVVTCKGNATINLKGTNIITGTIGQRNTGNAIYIESGTLTINGPGSLTATGEGYYGGGICAEPNASILIQGGAITATSTSNDPTWGAPGIGHISAVYIEGSGTIYITGGTIKAQGGGTAAGIGSGTMAHIGSILITGSKTVVTARKGDGGGGAEDIGRGDGGSCRSITFTGGAIVNGQRYE